MNSILSNLPAYFISLFPIPVGVARYLEKFQRDILWVDVEGVPKCHIVSWSSICTMVYYVGLGLKNLHCWANSFGAM